MSEKPALDLQTILDAIVGGAEGRDRYVVAIAGAPGAGKSTLALALNRDLPQNSAAVVEMDGFHYDNAVLAGLGLRERKGSPESFDYGGLVTLLRRIRDRERDIAAAVFDRPHDLSRAAARLINQATKYIIIEGNYLLLDESPWSGLQGYFDLTIFIHVPKRELKRRLLERWLDLGYSLERAAHWVASNDMPNVERVLSSRRMADIVFTPAGKHDGLL